MRTTGRVLAALQAEPIALETLIAAVGDDGAGGTVTFIGTVRNHDHEREVSALRYDAHPGAQQAIESVVGRIAAIPEIHRAAAVHRVGELAIGDVAVAVAVSAAHRADAFEAARRLIDEIKAEVPIWKLQRFADGDTEWVGAC